MAGSVRRLLAPLSLCLLVLACKASDPETKGEAAARVDNYDKSPARPQNPAPPFPYTIEELEIPNPAAAGVRLAATLTTPAGPGPHPIVVLISGSGLQDRDETIAGHKPFWLIADRLSRGGIAVVRYDDRGFAASTGEGTTATLEDFAGDAWAVAAHVASRANIDGERLGLIGHSEGGVIAPLLASRHPDAVDFLILLAGPGVTGSEIVVHQLGVILPASGVEAATVEKRQAETRRVHTTLLAQDREHTPAALEPVLRELFEGLSPAEKQAAGDLDAAIEIQLATLNSPWFRYFLTWDPVPALSEVQVPVLVLAGDHDMQVDPRQNLPPMREALATNPRAEFVVLPGLNHLFQPASTGAPNEYATIETTFDESAMVELTRFAREAAKLN